MSSKRFRIELTKDQQDHVKEASGRGEASGREIRSLEVKEEEVEERIAPAVNAYINIPGI